MGIAGAGKNSEQTLRDHVLDLVKPEIVRNIHMEYMSNMEHALRRPHELQGPDAKIAVIPNGLSVIVS